MIITVLSPESTSVLTSRLPKDLLDAVGASGSSNEWWTAIPPSALVVLDPIAFANDDVLLAMAGTAVLAASARVVFYTSFSPESMRAVAFAASLSPVELWIMGIDDRAQEFGRRVQRLAAHDMISELLAQLLARSEALPRAIRAAVAAVFTAPERFFEANDVARVAMTSRRNLDRHLAEHQLGTARRLVVAARIAHGVARMGGPDGAARSQRSVSDSLGYSDPEVFARQFAEVLGCRPAARGSLDDSSVIASIVAYARAVHAPQVTPFATIARSDAQLAAL